MDDKIYNNIDIALTALLEAKAEIVKYNLNFSKAISDIEAKQFKEKIYNILYPNKTHQAINPTEEDMPTITLKTGSLRKRPDGLFEVRFYVAKKRYSVYDKSADGCVKKANKLIREKTREEKQKPVIPSLKEWLYKWLETFKKPYVSLGQFRALETNIRLHILPNTKNITLDKYKQHDCQNIINSIDSQRAKKDAFEILTAAFDKAVICETLAKSPMNGLQKPKYKKAQGAALTASEQREFLSKIQSIPEKNALLFLLHSGLRRTELVSLKWQDIDFKGETIHVRGTKTKTSDRVLPLLLPLRHILDDLQKNGEKIFHFSADHLTKLFKQLCPNHKLHDLRHTFATNCLEKGISMKVLQRWLGHSDYGTTANIYSHVTDDFSRKEAKKYSAQE